MTESSAVMESVLAAIQEAEWPGKYVAEFLLFASQKDPEKSQPSSRKLRFKNGHISSLC
jgi:hypothetical protein